LVFAKTLTTGILLKRLHQDWIDGHYRQNDTLCQVCINYVVVSYQHIITT